MSRKLQLFLFSILSLTYMFDTAKSDSMDFIKSECRTTRYPTLCVQCLSNYSTTIQQNQRELAQAAITVSLTQAQSVSSFVSKVSRIRGMKPRQFQAAKDCADIMKDTVYQLSRSVKELDGMGKVRGQSFDWHVSNVQTWCSAALTNENTCLDGFSGSNMDGSIKVAIRRRVLDCAQVTSNALALVNRFATRHKAGDNKYP